MQENGLVMSLLPPPVSSTRKPWVVCKFGGTSVSYAVSWKQIINRVRELSADFRVALVLSALTQVTNRLEKCLEEAVANKELESLSWIEETHRRLVKELGLPKEAMQSVVVMLEELAQILQGLSLIKEVSPRLKARVCAYGEKMSTSLAVEILRKAGLAASLLDSKEFLVTDHGSMADEDKYLNATVIPKSDPEFAESLIERQTGQHPDLVVMQGFVARSHKGETCLLGRGGSDTSGSLIAALFGAHHFEIWTDVYGMFSGDPRKMPHARLIKKIGSRQAEELATCGAKVLHPRCIMPAAMFGVPIEIRNTMDPRPEYTKITVDDFLLVPTFGTNAARGLKNRDSSTSAGSSPRGSGKSSLSPRHSHNSHKGRRITRSALKELQGEPAFCGVVSTDKDILLTVTTLEMWGASGFLARCFKPFEDWNVCVDQVATSQKGISVTISYVPGGIDGDSFQGLIQDLENIGDIDVLYPCSVVTVVGRRILELLPSMGPSFSAFQETEVLMMSASSEDVAISFVVKEEVCQQLVELLHSQLIPVDPACEQGADMYGPCFSQIEHQRRVSQLNGDGVDADALAALSMLQGP